MTILINYPRISLPNHLRVKRCIQRYTVPRVVIFTTFKVEEMVWHIENSISEKRNMAFPWNEKSLKVCFERLHF